MTMNRVTSRAFTAAAFVAIAGLALLTACQGQPGETGQAGEATSTPLTVKPPLGLEPVPVPDDNPMTVEKVALGKQLYFDGRLSKDGTVSCATCHDPDKGWTDQSPVSTGVGGQKGTRSAPTVINSAYGIFQFWDGRAPSLEEQAKGPIENPVEMGETLDDVAARINAIPGYRTQFQNVFGTGATGDNMAQAIAAFERTILSGNSPYDRYQAGDKGALSEEAQRGLALFTGKANCSQCHVGFDLSDGVFHNLGVGMDAPEPDLGRYKATKDDKDKGAFKTPILRDLTKTAPYMHDGSEATLESVVELYNRGGDKNPWLDPKMVPLGLDDQEKADLVAFLKSLDGDVTQVERPTLP